jgi:hypothetical protein
MISVALWLYVTAGLFLSSASDYRTTSTTGASGARSSTEMAQPSTKCAGPPSGIGSNSMASDDHLSSERTAAARHCPSCNIWLSNNDQYREHLCEKKHSKPRTTNADQKSRKKAGPSKAAEEQEDVHAPGEPPTRYADGDGKQLQRSPSQQQQQRLNPTSCEGLQQPVNDPELPLTPRPPWSAPAESVPGDAYARRRNRRQRLQQG